MSVQADVLHRLLLELGLIYFLIGHDLGVIRSICDEVAVIYRGKLVEQGPVARIFDHPASDYTQAPLAVMPDPGPDRSSFRQPEGAAI